jgi:hypothetical protein
MLNTVQLFNSIKFTEKLETKQGKFLDARNKRELTKKHQSHKLQVAFFNTTDVALHP